MLLQNVLCCVLTLLIVTMPKIFQFSAEIQGGMYQPTSLFSCSEVYMYPLSPHQRRCMLLPGGLPLCIR